LYFCMITNDFRMKNRLFLWGCGCLMLIASSCGSHYRLADVQRSRILIDKHYDTQIDNDVTAFLSPYRSKVDSIMSPVVGSIAKYMAAQKPESEISNLLSDILIWGGKAYDEHPDLAVYNMGGIRAAFAKGKVTYGDVVDVAPFENKICFLTLSGDKLMELFQQIAKRGGEGVSHGVRLVITSKGHLKSALLNGKEIDPQASYRISTLDYLAQGNDGLLAFKSGTNLKSPQTAKSSEQRSFQPARTPDLRLARRHTRPPGHPPRTGSRCTCRAPRSCRGPRGGRGRSSQRWSLAASFLPIFYLLELILCRADIPVPVAKPNVGLKRRFDNEQPEELSSR